MATGSFYNHFDGKAEVFAAVMAEVHEETLYPQLEEPPRRTTRSMVFVHGARIPFDSLVATVTRLWANALRIPTDRR